MKWRGTKLDAIKRGSAPVQWRGASAYTLVRHGPHGGLRTFHQASTYPEAIEFKLLCGTNWVTLPARIEVGGYQIGRDQARVCARAEVVLASFQDRKLLVVICVGNLRAGGDMRTWAN